MRMMPAQLDSLSAGTGDTYSSLMTFEFLPAVISKVYVGVPHPVKLGERLLDIVASALSL
jgi:hypothetical protein